MNSRLTFSVTSSPESADGQSRSNSPDGRTPNLSGRDHAPASRSVSPEADSVRKTPAICGLSLPDSSAPPNLQSSLASRLRARLDVNGSPEYSLTWKEWTISGQQPICALRASARPTSGKDSTGWQTPTVQDAHGRDRHNQKNGTVILSLLGQARLAGWPTTRANDGTGAQECKGRTGGPSLKQVVGWATPSAAGSAGETSADLERVGNKWRNKKTGRILQTNLATDAKMLCGWATPMWKDSRGNHSDSWGQVIKPIGSIATSFPASTGKSAALNPAHSRWLMGYKAAWDSCGATAMQSSRKLRANLSARG